MQQQFGHSVKELFDFEPGFVCVNHSSYGQLPNSVSDFKHEITRRYHRNPDKFEKYDYLPLAQENKKAISEFLNAPDDQTFLTTNTTDAFNSVVKSLKLKQGDVVVYNNMNYPMVKSMMQYLKDFNQVESIEINFKVEDLTNEIIIQKYKDQLESNNQIKVAIFDLISSNPSILFPVRELIKLCKKHNVIGIMDSAHGAGIYELDLSELDPDFCFTNLHKWAFVPPPCTLLYANKKFVDILHSNTTSIYYGLGAEQEFAYNGTLDRTNNCCIKKSLEFINSIGLKNIMKYSYDLAWQGGQKVKEIWNTELLVQDRNLQTGMVMIRVPCDDFQLVLRCQKMCQFEFNTLMSISNFDGHVWARITAQVYNEISDYEYAAKTLLDIINREQSK